METSGQIVITVWGSDIAGGGISEGSFHWGTSKTNLINTQAAVIEGDDYKAVGTIDGLTNGKKYFFPVQANSSGEASRLYERYLPRHTGCVIICYGVPT
ncbi:unnamed protein product [marine sediment metagenome]|uniref:Purple acid phosphatase N-terminal domain-containing protein n=1 Tax=marine sediment metagenome TaxID=412755 RepID=X1PQA7_9ZZZZ